MCKEKEKEKKSESWSREYSLWIQGNRMYKTSEIKSVYLYTNQELM